MDPSPFLQDTAGSVKLWEITRGTVIEDFGKVYICTLIISIAYLYTVS